MLDYHGKFNTYDMIEFIVKFYLCISIAIMWFRVSRLDLSHIMFHLILKDLSGELYYLSLVLLFDWVFGLNCIPGSASPQNHSVSLWKSFDHDSYTSDKVIPNYTRFHVELRNVERKIKKMMSRGLNLCNVNLMVKPLQHSTVY